MLIGVLETTEYRQSVVFGGLPILLGLGERLDGSKGFLKAVGKAFDRRAPAGLPRGA